MYRNLVAALIRYEKIRNVETCRPHKVARNTSKTSFSNISSRTEMGRPMCRFEGSKGARGQILS